MNTRLRTYEIDEKTRHELHDRVKSLSQVTPLSYDFSFSSLLSSYGILREVGSPNDETARFLFDSTTGKVVPRSSLVGRLVKMKNSYGVEIESTFSKSLEIKAYGVRELLHPDYSFNPDGTVKSLVIFPEAVFKIAALKGIELTIVRDWAINSIFGGFDPQKEYYQTNFWELENNDTILFARLIKNKQLAFLGTHDFIAHVANIRSEPWEKLSQTAQSVEMKIKKIIAEVEVPTIASLILPYTAGVILDDLAQPPSYDSKNHNLVLDTVLESIDRNDVPANYPCTLSKFPKTFEQIILLSRSKMKQDKVIEKAKELVETMVREIKSSLVYEGMEEKIGERLFSRLLRGY
ncbi:MAG: hypothetical protein H6621_10845 [Halobacteriovoraceae bacterium]|nr:hypothetical protein [Halobacteriovoraceae bacterium]MCB9095555.1 hypothetical protein [Halobacteriovoraceae bacterium]